MTQAPRVYVRVRFAGSRKTYTYHHDSRDWPAIGEEVLVETRDGKVVVTVDGFTNEKPAFTTKPIERLGREDA